ncbi:M23 family metallopeptidase [Thermodesulfobacteriota bacterium]
MHKKVTFFVLSTARSSARRITISKAFLRFVTFSLIACLIFVGYLIYDYYHLKGIFINTQELESRISHQQNIISIQQRQIQNFAHNINDLKSELISLNDFEKKIRIIANLEKPVEQDSLFGIGGSRPEDIDPKVFVDKNNKNLLREMHDQVKQLDQASKGQNNAFESLLKSLENQRNLLACTPAIRPTNGWTTSRFGYRMSPFTGLREFHKGLDIANRKGTPVRTTADGVITYIGHKGLLGKVVVIDHGHGLVTRYSHIDKALKKRGSKVKRGDFIATIGNSGRTTGTHLHYEILVNGIPVNPEKYILN